MNRQIYSLVRFVTIVLVVTSGALITHQALAESTWRDGKAFRHTSRDFGPHRLFKLLHQLDVTREQRTAIGEIMDEHRPVMREFMFDMMDGKQALHAILTSDDYDPSQIEALALKQAENAEQMFLATAKTFADISAILTHEQRQQLADMIEERQEKRRERHRRHREEREAM